MFQIRHVYNLVIIFHCHFIFNVTCGLLAGTNCYRLHVDTLDKPFRP